MEENNFFQQILSYFLRKNLEHFGGFFLKIKIK
jgi:hypothetical protein